MTGLPLSDVAPTPGVEVDGRRFRAPLLVTEFPPEVAFGFLERVLPTTEPVDLRMELERLAPDRAIAVVERARSIAEAELGDPGSGQVARRTVEEATARDLGEALARRRQELWRVGLVFVATAATRARAEAVRARLAERLRAVGFRTRIPRYEAAAALRGPDLSGAGSRPLGYWHTLPSDGVAALFPFGDETVVEPGGILVGLTLADASPVFLDRWRHASHSWGIFGSTGAGKTFAAALYLLRSRWARPGLDVIVLDPLGEFSGFVRALGGDVVDLSDPAAGRINPLDPVTTGGDRTEKASRVAAMLRALFPSLLDEEGARLDAAVSRLYARGAGVPVMSDLVAEVSGRPGEAGRLGVLLDVFRTGSLRALDGPTTAPLTGSPVAIDLSRVPEAHRGFHLTYLLDWAYGRLRERPGPKLVVVDEAHLLAHPFPTAAFLDRVVRHVRHFEAGLLILSQNPDDFLDSAHGRSTLRNLDATALLHLAEVSGEARRFFGLTDSEAEWLPRARSPQSAGYSESLWRVADAHLPLAIVASTPEFEFLRRALGAARSPAVREDGL